MLAYIESCESYIKCKSELLWYALFCVILYIRASIVFFIFGNFLAPTGREVRNFSAFSVINDKTGKTSYSVCGSNGTMLPYGKCSTMGVDSHADVSCAGKDTYVVSELSGRMCEVKGFHDSYGSITNVKYVNVVYKYHDEEGQEYLLELNHALDFTDSMENSILCTNQARHNGVLVHDIPKIINPNSPQCISFPNEGIHLPLIMKGPVPALPVSKPTQNELTLLPRLQLTSDDVVWDPNVIFGNTTDIVQFIRTSPILTTISHV